jgi:RNA-directed DNA polymerase
MVNGPEDSVLDWDSINWRTHEDNVRRLRARIFTAAREQDLKKVRNLQKMMLRSWSNTLVSVRQVTQRNAGRGTAGVCQPPWWVRIVGPCGVIADEDGRCSR